MNVNSKLGLKAAILAGSVMLASNAGFAATATDTMDVSATITNVCAVAVEAMAFGSVDAQAGDNADADVSVSCSINPAAATVNVNGGSYFSTSRQMASGANRLAYILSITENAADIAVDAAMTMTAFTNGVATGTIYGRIPANQGKPVGAYEDTVTMTVNYTP